MQLDVDSELGVGVVVEAVVLVVHVDEVTVTLVVQALVVETEDSAHVIVWRHDFRGRGTALPASKSFACAVPGFGGLPAFQSGQLW